ncbi:MAG TPA: class I SAM-dependent methyltransferase [Terracidiphilus sp.]|nr:class I SAM-dependent methyltransferase [Terracidiphilus sp.]
MFRRIFEKKFDGSPVPSAYIPRGPRQFRHSGGWATVRKRLQTESGLRIIDIGHTSPGNINYLTNLGHSIFLADPVADAASGHFQTGTDDDGKPILDTEGFLAQCFDFGDRTFDVILLWTALDYLPEPFVAPLVGRLYGAMNPGGLVLALFHTKKQGKEAEYSRYHVTEGDDVESQPMQPFPIQRVFTNRSIQQLFTQWSGFKQFLAKDSVSEVIITR